MVIQLFEDENNNGIMDPEDGMVMSVLTDGDTGGYCFEDVTPGTYVIFEVQLPSYGDLSDVDATPDPDGNDAVDGADNNIPVVPEPEIRLGYKTAYINCIYFVVLFFNVVKYL